MLNSLFRNANRHPGFFVHQLLPIVVLAHLLWPEHSCAHAAVDAAKREISIGLSTEPPALNTIKATDSESFRILDHITEGLTGYDKNGQLTGGVASRWEFGPDSVTFWIREQARWEDGVPVRAQDFVFAWRQVVDPANASEYAYLLYPITNAEAINRGDLPVDALGVQAVSDRQLKVLLHEPTSYFPELVAFITYRPIREDVFRRYGQAYAADAGKMLSNGPFKLSDWVHGAGLKMVRNAEYWNSAEVWLRAINVDYITSDPGALFNLFRDGKIALTSLDESTMREALRARMHIQRFLDGAIFYLEFNHRASRLTSNRHLRKAIQLCFDANEFVSKVIGIPGNVPARSLIPGWMAGLEKRFQQEFPPPAVRPDPEAAQREFEQARRELGLDRFPPLVLLLGDGPSAGKQGEYLQSILNERLGLKLLLDKQIFKQRLAKMSAGDFDLVGAGWGPDYNDPMTFADLFASWNENNRGRYSNPQYDSLVRMAQRSTDPIERMRAFAAIQDLVIEEAVIVLQYERGSLYVQHPQLHGVRRQIFGGDPIFSYATITGETQPVS